MGKSNNTLWTLTPGGTIPTEDDFLLHERRIIQTHQSPEKVQHFLRSIPYNRELGGETCYSFRRALKENRVHCLEGALVAAVILEQHGYPPILVSIESQDNLDHVLLLFRRNDRYGSVARSRDIGLHGRKPVFRTVRDLVMSYFEPYIDKTARVTGYAVASLYELGNYDWRLSMRNVLKVERYLQDIPHKQVRSSEARYERARRRYLEFHREHPDRSPDYFANRSLWLS
jgi:hypothetical protein